MRTERAEDGERQQSHCKDVGMEPDPHIPVIGSPQRRLEAVETPSARTRRRSVGGSTPSSGRGTRRLGRPARSSRQSPVAASRSESRYRRGGFRARVRGWQRHGRRAPRAASLSSSDAISALSGARLNCR
jgi:hypothetical protein